MQITKQISGFSRILNGKEVKHPSYTRTFDIVINLSKKISYGDGRICPFCNSPKEFHMKQGHRKIQKRANTQRYFCYWCERRFSLGGDMHRMRNDRKIIEKALILRKKGHTLREIRTKLNNIVSHITILRWIKKWDKKTNQEKRKNMK